MGEAIQKSLNKYLPKSEFLRNVLTLMSGTVISQAIPIIISPILTRLYSPEEFGTFGLFSSILAVLGVIGTARYEFAILLPKKEKDANNLTRLSFFLVTVFSLLTLIIFIPFSESITGFFGNKKLGPYLFLLPVGVAIVGCFNTFNYWSNRKKYFRRMAGGKVIKSSGNSSLSISFGFFKFGAAGLIIGNLVGQLLEAIYLGFNFFKENSLFTNRTFEEIKSVAKRYKKFPQYSLGSTLLNTASLQLPVIILSRFFDSSSAGLFFHAHKVLSLPMSVVGSSMGQVFFQEVSGRRNDKVFLGNFTYKTYRRLLMMGTVPLSIIFVFGDLIFGFVFGEEWNKAGFIAQLISPWLLMVFIFSPISTLTSVFERQEVALALNVTILIVRFSSLYLGSIYFNEIGPVVGIFGVSSFIIWLSYGTYLLNLAGVNIKKSLGLMVLFCLPVIGALSLLRFLLE